MKTLLVMAAIAGAAYYLRRVNMATKQEVLDAIQATNEQLAKAKNEVVQKITDLEEAVQNGADHEEILAAVTGLKTSAQALDDIVVDVPTEPTPGEGTVTEGVALNPNGSPRAG